MKKILISGCSGFIGQNLITKIIDSYNIIGIDNFISSKRSNIKKFIEHDNFKFIEHDIINPININEKVDVIYNLACPASPEKYQSLPLFTMDTNYLGTKNLLEIAKKHNSAFVQASTSEVYGDPKINPQDEMYFGNVNTTGIRSCYDEGKRIAETLCYEYNKTFGVNTKIIRIFNTYGPLMDINDGRVITNFFLKALKGFPIEIYGDGKQTRSFCYIDDLINGLIKCKDVDFNYPINLGNDNEISLNELAKKFSKIFSNLKINHINSAEDDPKIRRPDISRAKEILDWKPKYSLDQGLNLSYEYFKEVIKK